MCIGTEFAVTELWLKNYTNLAPIAQQFLTLQKVSVSAIFVIGILNDRVTLIERTKGDSMIDVDRICKCFGGGGHLHAASATLKNFTSGTLNHFTRYEFEFDFFFVERSSEG